jgi:glutathione synthase/RimK-type ligase-like ATP-grasp enzyme
MKFHQLNASVDSDKGIEVPVKSGKGAYFVAVPDNHQILMSPDGKGGLTAVWPNSMVLPQTILAPLVAKLDLVWFPPGNADALNGAPWIINNSGDADAYEGSLTWFCSLPAASRVPVFNHPDAILRTRRDRISRMLQGIPGLVVPKCVRFKPGKPQDFGRVFEAEGFQYPVLVRPVGTQTGRNLLKISKLDSWADIYKIPWGGSHMFMTQFVDFAGADSRYTKIRIAFVGNEHVLRHVKFSDDWLVHNDSKANERVSEEMRILDELASSEMLANIINAAKKHVRLDYWGMDIGYQGPGKPFVFFEANASMSILQSGLSQKPRNTSNSPDAIRKAGIKGVVSELLAKHLANPKAWISGRNQA